MITLYHSPLLRSVRIYWLLEELGLPYRLETLAFTTNSPPFHFGPEYLKVHPLGKIPAIRDGDLTLFESGAILEYILEKYGNGRLAPAPGTSARPMFLQWLHFAEGTATPPIAEFLDHTFFRLEAERIPAVAAYSRTRVVATLDMLEQVLAGKQYLLGAEFTAADIMMGVTLLGPKWHALLDDAHPNLLAYVERLVQRPALQKALGADAA